MSRVNFSCEFKRDAVAQITERGYPVAEVSQRMGVSQPSLYAWKKKVPRPAGGDDKDAEIRRLKRDLVRVTEEREILKKPPRVFRQRSQVRYPFIAELRDHFGVRAMCRCLAVQPSGCYAWRKAPLNQRAREDARQTQQIRQAWNDGNKVYGYRKLHDDLLDQGETCCPSRLARLTRIAGIKAQIGYKSRSGSYGVKPSVAIDNTLARQFDVAAPGKAWVTDVTYIRTMEGFAYLAVVLDLYSSLVVGWPMRSRRPTDLVLQALHIAVCRRNPKHRVLIHLDQGSQFTSMDWAAFTRAHNFEHSMSRRGNCHDNAVVESFFNQLKRERIRRRTYKTRGGARQDVFDYIVMFYNTVRKHVRNGMLSPVEFERQQATRQQGV
ncbi:IS3 family transposase [Altererythrobacter confluentis]|uniref:IS3 family transposase n=1 Tax=Allopontixanthobacter confluentis TaxID=1849021 RepID=A0A6L7GDQ7_9SPHN|nr:IS3 family transposase [Allopontixanthobacter confluentis]MXP13625.1 IS3 family transposase [Allopontixanthobacter confluentis]